MPSALERVTQAVLGRARTQGYVLPREIREELIGAGEAAGRWKEVVREAGPSLALRRGRYYFISRMRARMREEHRHFTGVRRAARSLIRTYKAATIDAERRHHRRIHFILPVTIALADGRQLHMLTQDVSLHGLRVVGCQELRGHKAQVTMPRVDKGAGQWTFTVHFLWSATVGDGLIESGGVFLELRTAPE